MFRILDYEKQKDRNPDRVDGTCQWFLQHPKFHDWQENKVSSLLWVSADPGCGKSVLAKSLVSRELLSTTTRTTCYFFFKDDDIDQKSATKALCSLLHQLFKQNPTLVKPFIPNLDGVELLQLFGNLWNILTEAVAELSAGTVICILDALDECEKSGRFEIVETLNRFYRNAANDQGHNASLKFLVTSRPYFNIERGFAELTSIFPSVHLAGEKEPELITREIDIVIKARVQQIGTKLLLDDAERSSLEEEFLNITHRTYLWVKLIFDVIEQRLAITKKRLREIVGTIPDTLNKAYEAILERSTNKMEARKLLHIVVSAIRPLTLQEMNIALAINQNSRSQEDLDLEPDERFRITVRNLCGLFVTVVDSKIYLIHQTAKEFLVKNNATPPSSLGIWKHSLEPSESNLVLGKICIQYLLFDVFESDPFITGDDDFIGYVIELRLDQHKNRHAFLDYSAAHWATHFQKAKVIDCAVIELALKICDCRTKRFLTWLQICWITVSSSSRCPQNFTDLMAASYLGLRLVVQALLEKGVEVEAMDENRCTALYYAAQNGYDVVVQLLLEKGAKIEAKGGNGYTALFCAAQRGHEKVLRVLLGRGAKIEAKSNNGQTALFCAAQHGHEKVLQVLLEKGAKIEAKGNNGQTALFCAAQHGHEKVLQVLLEKGAKIEAKGNNGQTALYYAVQNKHENVLRVLLEKGAAVNVKDEDGQTALHQATNTRASEAVVQLLLGKGADIEAKGHKGQTALHYAVQNGHKETVQILIEKGATIEAEDGYGKRALHMATLRGFKAIVCILLNNGVDIEAKDKREWTALHFATYVKSKAVVQVLLQNRAAIESKDEDGWTALHQAAFGRSEAIVRMLLENGADVNAKDVNRQTALNLAVAQGDEAIVQILLDKGAAVNAKDDDGLTALHQAAACGSEAVVRVLLEKGADVEAKDVGGQTALEQATRNGHDAIMQLLLENGAIEAEDFVDQM
ncbi:hypothetical protein V501_00489 [Pseudogymnoascus sp. VKM F-4519 (FW-2642)]|nr:hypothetical protein V501_00489 [Pseudogymnoascus sp. VKM F-4519 (FW-2642)]